MNRVLKIAGALVVVGALIIAVALLAGCGDSKLRPEATPSASSGLVESAPPSGSAGMGNVDYRRDVTDLKAVAASSADFPEGDTADVSMTITNHGDKAATYEIILGVYDKTTAQVGSILVSTSASNEGATKPGGTLKLSGAYGADCKLPNPFTVEVQSVDRQEA